MGGGARGLMWRYLGSVHQARPRSLLWPLSELYSHLQSPQSPHCCVLYISQTCRMEAEPHITHLPMASLPNPAEIKLH